MELRTITNAENQQMKTIIQADLKMNGLAQPGSVYFDPEIDNLTQTYQQMSPAAYWILVDGLQVVGGVGIAPYPDQPQTCELQKLYLSADYQGQGLSKILMDHALAYARAHYQQCYLETHDNLIAAWHLYEKYEFEPLAGPLGSGAHSLMNRWYIRDLQ